MNEQRNVPGGVKTIGVLYYIGSALMIIGALAMFLGAGAFGVMIAELGGFGAIGAAAFVFVGIILLIFGVLGIFIGRGLWKGQNWARILAIIFAILGLLSAIMGIVTGDFSSIVGLIIHGVIGGYLLFNVGVKQAFA